MEALKTQPADTDNSADLITDNIDIWTSAIQTRSISGRGSSKKLDLYGIKKLRELILELAVRGKLVEQDLNEEPASELLSRIAEKKLQLVKDKKIKKPKPLPEIAEVDNPYTLPQGWEMARLGDIVSIIRGITFPASEKYKEPSEGKIACLRTTNVQTEIEWDDLLYVDEKFVKRSEQNAEIGDIVMSMANSRELVGKVAYIASIPTASATFGGFLSVIRPYEISATFLMAILRTPHVRNVLIGSASQTTNIANISLEKLNPLLVTVPPIAEQHRIVAKVDELMALCDQLEQQTEASIDAHATLVETLLAPLTQSADAAELEQNWNRIADHFDTLFTTGPCGERSIDQLKQTVLQLAVMGKLVEQRHKDEHAQKVLSRALVQREKVTKELRLNRPAKLSSEFNSSDSLPTGWCYATPDELTAFYRNALTIGPFGSNLLKADYRTEGTPLVFVRDIRSETFGGDNTKFVTETKARELSSHSVQAGDLLITKMGDPPGDTSIYPDGRPIGIITADCIKLTPHADLVSSKYLRFAIRADFIAGQFTGITMGVAQKKVSLARFRCIAIPVPPLAEQHRIVAKVDQLMTLCDQLKARLQQAQQTQLLLADAMIEKALSA